MTDDPVAAIIINPQPPMGGAYCTVTYTGPLPVILELELDGSGEMIPVPIGDSGTTVLWLPETAGSYILSDPGGHANPLAGSIS